MTEHIGTRVDELSGGQRKRVSVAMELLTEPSLLALDEPTTGVDPALDQQVMTMLRRLADAGRVIVVATHSLRFLDVCDQVLLLAPGGKAAYCGPPGDVGEAMGLRIGPTSTPISWRIPMGRNNVTWNGTDRPPTPAHLPRPCGRMPIGTKTRGEFLAPGVDGRTASDSAVARRPALSRLLLVAPFMVGLLPLAVGGHAGFTKPPAGTSAPLEPLQLVVLLSFAAILMGLTVSVRGLIGERAIYRHEQAAGLSPSAYLLAKIFVFGAVAVIQSAILVIVVTAPGIGKPAPTTAAVLGSPLLELFVDVAFTAAVAVVLGLAISAVSGSVNQYIALLAVACTAPLVFAGSFIPITGRPVLEAIAAITPARWGVSAMASTVDLTDLLPACDDSHWHHNPSAWSFDIAMLVALDVAVRRIRRWRFRRKATRSGPYSSDPTTRSLGGPSCSSRRVRAAPASSGRDDEAQRRHPGSSTPGRRIPSSPGWPPWKPPR